MPDVSDFASARQRRDRKRTAAPVGVFGPSSRKREAIDRVMTKTRAAAEAAGRVPPTLERITFALNICGLYGPEVDAACGVEEPAVDEWEAGTRIPTREQVEALARLTGYPTSFFYRPAPEPQSGAIFMCGERGCEVVVPEDRTPSAPVLTLPGTDGRLF